MNFSLNGLCNKVYMQDVNQSENKLEATNVVVYSLGTNNNACPSSIVLCVFSSYLSLTPPSSSSTPSCSLDGNKKQ